MTEEDLSEYFEYLDWLRETGKTNMFDAVKYLVDCYGMTRKKAREILKKWMAQYRKDD